MTPGLRPFGSSVCRLVGLLAGAFVCCAAAGAQPGAFDYRGGAQGTVTFDHATHAARGYMCLECHTRFPPTGTQLFQTRRQGLISLPQHSSDTACFACHNGLVAFDTCRQCHRN